MKFQTFNVDLEYFCNESLKQINSLAYTLKAMFTILILEEIFNFNFKNSLFDIIEDNTVV